jgi:soluble lytic murein transglycosylase-like protein
VKLAQLLFVLSSLPLCAAQFAVLRSGFHVPFERAERSNGEIRLIRGGGEIVIREQDVAEWIHEADPPATTAAPTPEKLEPVSAPQTSVRDLIAQAAATHGLPEKFVASVARAESAFTPAAVSPKGAIGVMQLMPATAKSLGVDPNNVRENIEGGARLLRDLLLQYQDDPDQVRKALAAYNAGSGAVQKYNGIPPYRETVNYIDRVLKNYQGKSR